MYDFEFSNSISDFTLRDPNDIWDRVCSILNEILDKRAFMETKRVTNTNSRVGLLMIDIEPVNSEIIIIKAKTGVIIEHGVTKQVILY